MQNDLILHNFEQITAHNKNESNYTIVQLNEKYYAIKTNNVLEIIKLTELECPNNMPECILGFFEYKQNYIPVIDLRQIFQEERIVYDLDAKIIILKTESTHISIICDRVVDILKLNNNNIHPIPYQDKRDFFDGIYLDNLNNPYILNLDCLVKYASTNTQNETIGRTNYIINSKEAKIILEERKNFLKQIEENVPKISSIIDMGVSFKIDDIKYYINLASVKEFFKPDNAKITKIPSVPEFIIGLINIKGEYITILDIRNFYDGVKTTIKEKSTVIILKSEEYKIGILADEILENMNVNFNEIVQNKLQKQDSDKPNEFVKNDEIYQVLDIEKLLRDDRLAIC